MPIKLSTIKGPHFYGLLWTKPMFSTLTARLLLFFSLPSVLLYNSHNLLWFYLCCNCKKKLINKSSPKSPLACLIKKYYIR